MSVKNEETNTIDIIAILPDMPLKWPEERQEKSETVHTSTEPVGSAQKDSQTVMAFARCAGCRAVERFPVDSELKVCARCIKQNERERAEKALVKNKFSAIEKFKAQGSCNVKDLSKWTEGKRHQRG